MSLKICTLNAFHNIHKIILNDYGANFDLVITLNEFLLNYYIIYYRSSFQYNSTIVVSAWCA